VRFLSPESNEGRKKKSKVRVPSHCLQVPSLRSSTHLNDQVRLVQGTERYKVAHDTLPFVFRYPPLNIFFFIRLHVPPAAPCGASPYR
jgi:hypothetical protein